MDNMKTGLEDKNVKMVEDKNLNDLLYKIAESHMLSWKDIYDANKKFKNKKAIIPLPVPVTIGDKVYNAMCIMNMSDTDVPCITNQLVYWENNKDGTKYELCLSPKVKDIVLKEAQSSN